MYRPFNFKCEGLVNPLGVDIKNPKFSYVLKHKDRDQIQTSYQIIVSDNFEKIKNEIGNIWDSGRIQSDLSYHIKYSGKALESARKYFWRVRWSDKNGFQSEYSDIAFFVTGILNPEEWKGKWITKKEFKDFKSKGTVLSGQFLGDYTQVYAPYFRKEFTLKSKIKSAYAFVSGIGYYELRINGKKVGNHVLDPAQTDYLAFSLYSTFDVSSLLDRNNAIGIILGNGRHIQYYGFDFPKFIFQMIIEYDNGEKEIITSDTSWKSSHGPLTENSIYNGEIYDARLEMEGWDCFDFDDKEWEDSINIVGPKIRSQIMQPIRVTKHIKPQKMWSPSKGKYIFDFSQNFSGWVKLFVEGPKGTLVKMRFSELIYDDGSLNTLPNEKAEATDVYILKGDGLEIYEPKFTYHGFRYVEITGLPFVPSLDTIIGCFVHNDIEKSGEFYCSNELINKIHENIIWGQLSNLMSVPTDCSQRDERHGWMGDAHLSGEEAILNFDMYAFYKKYLNDIKYSQKEDGSIPDVVPPYYRNLYPADPAWGAAYMIFAYFIYFYYSDESVLEEHYNSLRKYIDFLLSNSENFIIKKLGKYGDWCPPGSVPPKMTPVSLVSTFYFYNDTLLFTKIAKVLGYSNDEKKYIDLSEKIKSAFNSEFLKGDMYESTTLVATENLPSQTSQVLPLYLDMVPKEKEGMIINKLLYSIINRTDFHVDTGIIGTRYLLEVLSKYGHEEIAYKIATNKSYPGWGYMVMEGATTLWERWEKLSGASMNSHNHIMFGSIDAWFYKIVGGITCLSPGFKSIQFKPALLKDIKFASTKLKTVAGEVKLSYEKNKQETSIFITVPVGSDGIVHFSSISNKCVVKESDSIILNEGKFLANSDNFKYISYTNKSLIIKINNGNYHFIIKN